MHLRSFALSSLLALATLAVPRGASAYPWMIRHDYSSCAVCHADPSGGGLVTQYGRAQGEILLRTHYTKKGGEEEEPGAPAKFAWGLVPLPDDLLLSIDSRSAELQVKIPGAPAIGHNVTSGFRGQFIQMQSDLRGQATFGKFRVNGSIAYAQLGDQPAALTRKPKDNVVSREHWIGYDVNGNVLVRAGRFQLPYGLRVIEHNLWVRSETRTDNDAQQQHGVSVAYTGEKWRGEIMGIAGDYQVRPDAFRERGYSGYAEFVVAPKTVIGYSSLFAHSQDDLVTRVGLTRQAYGGFVRSAPWGPFVMLGEEDVLIDQPKGGSTAVGSTGMFQLDAELVQGLHLIGTSEYLRSPVPGSGRSVNYWGTLDWFFASHADIRIDYINGAAATGPTITRSSTWLWQLHFYI